MIYLVRNLQKNRLIDLVSYIKNKRSRIDYFLHQCRNKNLFNFNLYYGSWGYMGITWTQTSRVKASQLSINSNVIRLRSIFAKVMWWLRSKMDSTLLVGLGVIFEETNRASPLPLRVYDVILLTTIQIFVFL